VASFIHTRINSYRRSVLLISWSRQPAECYSGKHPPTTGVVFPGNSGPPAKVLSPSLLMTPAEQGDSLKSHPGSGILPLPW